ncbi:MAG: NUDIX hydrolase [Candidatus Paceibacterota bacterium]
MKLFVGAKGVVHHKGKVLLVRESSEYADGTGEGQWDMVGGRIEPEETVRDGLVREVREESGLTVTPGALLDVFDGFPEIRGEACHVVRLYFLCEASSADVVLSDDHDSYEWVDPGDIGEKVLMNDIREMLDVAKNLL